MPDLRSLFHRCIHPGRTHLCPCDLNRDHSDVEWDAWYDRKENDRA